MSKIETESTDPADSIVYTQIYVIPIAYNRPVTATIKVGKGARVKFRRPNKCILSMGYDQETGAEKECTFLFTKAPKTEARRNTYPTFPSLFDYLGAMATNEGDLDVWSDCFRQST